MHGWCVCVLEGMADIWDHADLVCPVGLLVISHLLTFKSNHLGLQSHFLCVCVHVCLLAETFLTAWEVLVWETVYTPQPCGGASVKGRMLCESRLKTSEGWSVGTGPQPTRRSCVSVCVWITDACVYSIRVQYWMSPMLSITFWLSKGSGWSFLSCCFWLFICYLIFSNLSSGLLRQMEPGFKAGQIYFIKLVAVHPLALWKTSRRLTEKSDLSFFGLIKIRLTSRSDLYDHRHTGCVKYFIRQKYFSYKEHWFFSNRARI